MTAQEFINKYNGKGIDVDNAYGFQCVDLFDQYLMDVIGVPWYAVNGAKDIWTNSNTDKYFTKIKNEATNSPQLGDVVIWGMGTFGHVAIATRKGDSNTFESLDQNWPWGLSYNTHPASLIVHDYSGVIGWLRPKGADMIPVEKTNGRFYSTNDGKVLYWIADPETANKYFTNWTNTKPLSELVPPVVQTVEKPVEVIKEVPVEKIQYVNVPVVQYVDKVKVVTREPTVGEALQMLWNVVWTSIKNIKLNKE